MSFEGVLNVLLYIAVPVAWLSTVILGWATFGGTQIGALAERFWIALVLSVFLTSAGILVYNSSTEFALFPVEVARIVFRVSGLALALVPTVWVALWLTNRLGPGR